MFINASQYLLDFLGFGFDLVTANLNTEFLNTEYPFPKVSYILDIVTTLIVNE